MCISRAASIRELVPALFLLFLALNDRIRRVRKKSDTRLPPHDGWSYVLTLSVGVYGGLGLWQSHYDC
jgi:hypothetical protein